MSINHQLNAQLHKLPWCPECDAREHCACTNPNGTTRQPHAIRMKLQRNEVVVVNMTSIVGDRPLRALRSFVSAVDAERSIRRGVGESGVPLRTRKAKRA